MQMWSVFIKSHNIKHKTLRGISLYKILLTIRYTSAILAIFVSWWRHDMETMSTLLVLCEWKQPVTDGFTKDR